jgi:hypothetical protein
VKVQLHLFLITTPDGGVRPAASAGHFTPNEYVAGWVAELVRTLLEREISLALSREFLGCPAPELITNLLQST